MDKRGTLRDTMNEFVDAWDDFLMEDINTTTLTDHIIDLMRVIDDITGIKDPRTPSDAD